MKSCTKCRQTKPLDQFYWSNDARYSAGGFRRPDCKSCTKARVKARFQLYQVGGMPEGYSWGYGHHPNSLLGRGLMKRSE